MRTIGIPPAAAGAVLVLAALGACVSSAGAPVPERLALDRGQPALALFEHVLSAHFAGQGSGAAVTTCAASRPTALTAEQEEALMIRFVRLAPASRCEVQSEGPVDAITGERAAVIELYGFACADDTHCAGWINGPGQPSTRHAIEWRNGEWRITADRRVIAE